MSPCHRVYARKWDETEKKGRGNFFKKCKGKLTQKSVTMCQYTPDDKFYDTGNLKCIRVKMEKRFCL